MLPVPSGWSGITPEWATGALRPHWPGTVVGSLEVGPVARGTSERARVHLRYSEGVGPASVFVKGPGPWGSRLALGALGALYTEARLAASGARLPLAHPAFYAAGVDGRRLAAVVVMEDVVGAGGRPNRATVPLGAADVGAGLEGLARLHAAYWDRSLPRSLGFLHRWHLGPLWAAVSVANLARGLRRAGELGGLDPVHDRFGARALGRQYARSAALCASGPQTVLHGDPHPGNTYATAGGGTGFFDWQLARTGHWSHDVGYFLVASLPVAERRRHEASLLGRYLDALGAAGVRPPSWDRAWARYRSTPAYGLATWLHTLAFGVFQVPEVCLETIRRFAAAYGDLETRCSDVAEED